jgi:hypothetical protein
MVRERAWPYGSVRFQATYQPPRGYPTNGGGRTFRAPRIPIIRAAREDFAPVRSRY